ncbi:MAG: DUF5779 family protein [Haloferacaceae archaeon]
MSDFDLDLRGAEEQLGDEEGGVPGDVVLGVLDGSTDPAEWIEAVEAGQVLVLAVEGDVNRLAAGFARDVADMGGTLMHFRDFLLVAPPGTEIDNDRLN